MLRCLQHVVTGNVAGLLPETLPWATGVPFTGYEKQLGELELHYGIARLTACFFLDNSTHPIVEEPSC